jgi:hypothetical protein
MMSARGFFMSMPCARALPIGARALSRALSRYETPMPRVRALSLEFSARSVARSLSRSVAAAD